MLKNYILIGLRNLMRHKFYSLLNILGLAIGIACALLAVLYVNYHFKFEQHHQNLDRIYKVMRKVTDPNGTGYSQFTKPVAPVLKREFPEIEHAVRVLMRNMSVHHESQSFNVLAAIADKEIMNIFNIPMVQGDAHTGLDTPYSVFLSEKLAQNIFGQENPIGEVVTLDYKWIKGDYTITGVFANPPETTDIGLQFDFLTATFSDQPASNNVSWKAGRWENWPTTDPVAPISTYLLLREGIDAETLKPKLKHFSEKYHIENSKVTVEFFLQPFNRVHLHSREDYGVGPSAATITQCYMLLGIGFLVLSIACINYINLVTARSVNRMREVGVRKVAGAARSQLMGQFLGESILITTLACLFAILLAQAALPFFNLALSSHLKLSDMDLFAGILFACSMVIIIGLMAGSYPALILSSFAPVRALKGSIASGGRAWFRQTLVVIQFCASVILIISTLVVYRQVDYIRHKDLGFHREKVVALPFVLRDRALRPKIPLIKQEISKHTNVIGTTGIGILPGSQSSQIGSSDMRTFKANGQEFKFHWVAIDEDFSKTLGIDLVAGSMPSTSVDPYRQIAENKWETSILINETAAKMAGWVQPAGQAFLSSDGRLTWKVEGVVKDFHNRSLHHDVIPQIYQYNRNLNFILVRLGSGDLPESMAHLEKVWKQFHPTRPFEPVFLNDFLDRFYHTEITMGKIYAFFAGLSIFIGCLGILGLVSYASQMRTKEIGVRKILGATTNNLVLLLSRDFLILTLIANLISWPLSYLLATSWLAHFTYRITLGPSLFVITGLLTLLIVFITVGTQSWRAAQANPVESLRYE